MFNKKFKKPKLIKQNTPLNKFLENNIQKNEYVLLFFFETSLFPFTPT